MSHRVLNLPRVWASPDPEKVCVRVPIDGPERYFEMMMTPDEVDNLVVDLVVDRRRALVAVRSGNWKKQIAAKG